MPKISLCRLLVYLFPPEVGITDRESTGKEFLADACGCLCACRHVRKSKMAFTFYSLLEACLLVVNAVAVLHEERFLAKGMY